MTDSPPVLDLCGMITQGVYDRDLQYLEQALLKRRLELGPMKRKRGDNSTPRVPRPHRNVTPAPVPAPAATAALVTPGLPLADRKAVLINEFAGIAGDRSDRFPGRVYINAYGLWVSKSLVTLKIMGATAHLKNASGQFHGCKVQVTKVNRTRVETVLLEGGRRKNPIGMSVAVPISMLMNEYVKGNVTK